MSMLGRGMDFGYGSEPNFVVPIYRRLATFGDLEKPKNLQRLVRAVHSSQSFEHLRERHGTSTTPDEILERVQDASYTGVLYAAFALLAEKRTGRSRIAYKDPADVTHLSMVADLLPTSRFVHIIRDGRDVAISLTQQHWGPTNVYAGSRLWARSVASGRQQGAALGSRYFELRLEDLVHETEKTAGALWDFVSCGQDNFGDKTKESFIELVNTSKKSGRNAWEKKLSKKQRYACEAAAGRVLRECGYPTEVDPGAAVGKLSTAGYLSADFVARVRNHLSQRVAIWPGRSAT